MFDSNKELLDHGCTTLHTLLTTISAVYRCAATIRASSESPASPLQDENQHMPVFVSVQILTGMGVCKHTLCPFMLRVKSLVSCIQSVLQVRKVLLGFSFPGQHSGMLFMNRGVLGLLCPHVAYTGNVWTRVRMVLRMVWDGRDLKDHLIPTPCHC